MKNLVNKLAIDTTLLNNSTILITGATGLIGRNFVDCLCLLSKQKNIKMNLILCGRSREKLECLFTGINIDGISIEYYINDIADELTYEQNVDYVIHMAAQTSSNAFQHRPVEVIETTLIGTKNILEFAKIKSAKSMVFLSTMEVYGTPKTDEIIDENHSTNLLTTNVRSCYPESKRLCENLCTAYAMEYSVPVKTIRLTQTFGKGVEVNDGRVFAEFARCVINKKDIILRTKGLTKRSYLSVEDACSAILTVLLNGTNGEAYNAANEQTYCTIYDMAKMVSDIYGDNTVKVKIEEEDISKFGYAPELHMNLSTKKLKALGWEPQYDLNHMFVELICYMKKQMESQV